MLHAGLTVGIVTRTLACTYIFIEDLLEAPIELGFLNATRTTVIVEFIVSAFATWLCLQFILIS